MIKFWELIRAELRTHLGRAALAVFAIAAGVALGFGIHLVNLSALSEFSSAVRQANAEPDLELQAARGTFDEAWYAKLARHPLVLHANPILELDVARPGGQPFRLVGLDLFTAVHLSPRLLPTPNAQAPRLAMLDADSIFLDAELSKQVKAGRFALRAEGQSLELKAAGRLSLGENKARPTAVMDLGAMQWRFGKLGQLSRVDIKLVPGARFEDVRREIGLPAAIRAQSTKDGEQRISNLSRAYRVNLAVLALVALFTGGFLVFSIQAQSVARRTPQLALLGVLGASARERLGLVLWECAILGLAGAALGVACGTALAAWALNALGGDLGSGFFSGIKPSLQWSTSGALVYGLLGLAASLAGGLLPALAAARLAPAQGIKGMGHDAPQSVSFWPALGLGLAALVLGFLPPIGGVAWFAYASVACILFAAICTVPLLLGLLRRLRLTPPQALALLAVKRAEHERLQATAAICSVVASLALAVALTVMVASFRQSVTSWLDTVLPSDLYVRQAQSRSNATSFFDASELDAIRSIPGVRKLRAYRQAALSLDPSRPSVSLVIRDIEQAAQDLPLVSDVYAAAPNEPLVYVSEAMQSLYGAKPGTILWLPLSADTPPVQARVVAVWRDYARQHGTIVLSPALWAQATGERGRFTDVALWLDAEAAPNQVQAAVRARVRLGEQLEFASSAELRKLSLQIFDRSFAVTYWLQALAIGIGLVGIAASFSSQALTRRKEFGVLMHLGLSRAQVLKLVSLEGAVWTSAGAAIGVLAGLAVSVILVHVVNPQSFHWTMDLSIPWSRLGALALAVLAAGTITAGIAAHRAVGAKSYEAVKEDW